MIITRSNYLKLIPENIHEKIRIEQMLKEKCVYENPLYEKKTRHLKNPLFSKEPKFIKTYSSETKAGTTTFKILKANKDIYDFIKKMGFPLNIVDQRTTSKADINALVGPRDEEQRLAIDSILHNEFGYGLLSASPSAGKTVISLICASQFKQKTLILVDMTLLIDQFIDSILNFTDVKEEEIGLIRGKEKNYKDKKIVIATIQTLSKKDNENIIKYLNDNIGFVICDEVHIMSCNMAQSILNKLKPKYMLGLSGTPHRDDKMDFIITQSIGPIIHQSNRQAMVEAGSMVTPILRPLFLQDDELFKKYNLNEEIDFRDVVDIYYNSPKAIDKITNLISFHYNNGDSQLVICKENNLINEYYQVLLKKLFGKNIQEDAEQERNYIILSLEEEIKKIPEMTIMDIIGKRDKKYYEDGKLTLKQLEDIYTEKLPTKKEEKEKDLYKQIEKYTFLPWYEMPCIKRIPNINSVYIFTGSTSKKERDRIINEVNSGKIKILLVTTVFDKAISCNRLNILYLTFSTRERANTIQRVG